MTELSVSMVAEQAMEGTNANPRFILANVVFSGLAYTWTLWNVKMK